MSVSDSLGERRTVDLDSGTLEYRESGSGPPLVFVHGAFVNGDLWRHVAPRLADRFRCIVPDWPLGSHRIPMSPNADLTPPGLAAVVIAFLDALGLAEVTLVGSDTGGAICQIAATRHPERFSALVLTPCDALDNFPPRMYRYVKVLPRVPGGMYLFAQAGRLGFAARLPMTYGWVAKTPREPEVTDSYVRPVRESRGVRRDAAKVFRGLDPRYTLKAAEALRSFSPPLLLVWAREDRFFPLAHAQRLARLAPHARLEVVEDSLTYVAEDQPARLTGLIRNFAGSLAHDRG